MMAAMAAVDHRGGVATLPQLLSELEIVTNPSGDQWELAPAAAGASAVGVVRVTPRETQAWASRVSLPDGDAQVAALDPQVAALDSRYQDLLSQSYKDYPYDEAEDGAGQSKDRSDKVAEEVASMETQLMEIADGDRADRSMKTQLMLMQEEDQKEWEHQADTADKMQTDRAAAPPRTWEQAHGSPFKIIFQRSPVTASQGARDAKSEPWKGHEEVAADNEARNRELRIVRMGRKMKAQNKARNKRLEEETKKLEEETKNKKLEEETKRCKH